ncbi:putative sulfate exporter family transporter [Lactobacillus sp. PFC-70]|uniref:YeiH family protein n=1 Tax=Levilactobacillus namurensis TaxID=380393 RepID=UPI000D2F572D|nr:putative sulfate exporter family transporter [Levilactobacillus namurensis]MDT7017772.1 putative sulfate exporter family transporter [Levilactobacillus namurensis]PTM22008.1 putative sulfate exporter family transporter [Lactobacillus sp. PFC-70]WNN65226.1 putative sulfate exporter family transporter [Levilactobacillus namurensis]HJE44278.1 putative sulfate exporter family transporter [Levilactobacillus namurensis]
MLEIRTTLASRPFWGAAVITLICAVAGSELAQLPYLNLVGALVIALLLGMACQVRPQIVAPNRAGIGFISNKFLRLGIILLGFKLNLIQLASAGVKTISLAAVIVTGMVLLTYNLSRKMGVDKDLAILTATGTSICGAAAVMGVSPQIKVPAEKAEQQRENEVLAVAIVAILGTVFTLIEIGLKPLLHLTAVQFGVLTGGSLHEIAHAVAAGSAGGPVSLDTAIITKLSRVLLLAPAAVIIGLWYQKSTPTANTDANAKLPIPWFMAGFILTSLIGTFIPLGDAALAALVKLAYIFLGMAMAALGMSVNFRVIAHRGGKPFLAASIASVILMSGVALASKLFF